MLIALIVIKGENRYIELMFKLMGSEDSANSH